LRRRCRLDTGRRRLAVHKTAAGNCCKRRYKIHGRALKAEPDAVL